MTKPQQKLIIIAGPTASGKSAVAVELAKRIHGGVISADSMQVYRGMDIGTAKITPEEMQGVPHALIDILEPEEEWNVVLFQQKAKEAIRQFAAQGRTPILCGGTGFYIQALLYDIDFTKEEADTSLREKWQQAASAHGPDGPAWLHAQLEAVDPASAAAIPVGNVRRVIRALEYHEKTGEKISDLNARQHQQQPAYDASYYVLTRDRQKLYQRIDERVDKMMQEGLLDEVRALRSRGLSLANQSMQGLGYRQILEYLDGRCTLEEAITQIKLQTRHFAKRQETWFRREQRRDPNLVMLNADAFPDAAALATRIIALES